MNYYIPKNANTLSSHVSQFLLLHPPLSQSSSEEEQTLNPQNLQPKNTKRQRREMRERERKRKGREMREREREREREKHMFLE
jgi:hypothetical protein